MQKESHKSKGPEIDFDKLNVLYQKRKPLKSFVSLFHRSHSQTCSVKTHNKRDNRC